MSAKTLAAFEHVVDQLAAAGVHRPSDYWMAEVERFYLHPTAKLFVQEVGRGGAKTMIRVIMTIAEALAGDFVVPVGERHYFAHVSENAREADKTIKILLSYLQILGVRFETRNDSVELLDRPLGVRVLPCRIGAVSGFRCCGWTADEASKWDNDGVNPAEEVIASIRAMTVTHATARGGVVSSPLGKAGYFYDACRLGDTDGQTFGHAASWIANPGALTEEYTRTLAPHKVWLREYLAEAQEGASAALDSDQVRAALRPFRQGHPLGPPFLGADLSQGKKDSTAWCVGQWWQPVLSEFERYDYTFNEDTGGWTPNWAVGTGSRKPRVPAPPEPRPELRITSVTSAGAFVRDGRGLVTMDHVYDAIGRTAQQSGARVAFADDYLGEAAKASMALRKVSWDYKQWNPGTIEDQFAVLRGWLRDGELAIEDTPMGHALVRELVGLAEIVRPSGGLSFGGRRGTHDDLAACVRSIAQAQAELRLPGSPVRHRGSEIQIFTGQGRRLY